MELISRLFIPLMIMTCLSCGDPVDADKNIVKVKLIDGFEMFDQNNNWKYTYDIKGSNISNFQIPNEIIYSPTSVVRKDSSFSMKVNSIDKTIDCSYRDNVMFFSSDPFEIHFDEYTPISSSISLEYPLDKLKTWDDDNWKYELIKLDSLVVIKQKEYNISIIRMSHKISINYKKDIFIHENIGILGSRYSITEPRQLIDAEIIFSLEFD